MKIVKNLVRSLSFAVATITLLSLSARADIWPAPGNFPHVVPWSITSLVVVGDVASSVGSALTYNGISQISNVNSIECGGNSTCIQNLERVKNEADSLLSSDHNVVAMGASAAILGAMFDVSHFFSVTSHLSDGKGIVFGVNGNDLPIYAILGGMRGGIFGLAYASIFYGGVSCDETCLNALPQDARSGIDRLHMSRLTVSLPSVIISNAGSIAAATLSFFSFRVWFTGLRI